MKTLTETDFVRLQQPK